MGHPDQICRDHEFKDAIGRKFRLLSGTCYILVKIVVETILDKQRGVLIKKTNSRKRLL